MREIAYVNLPKIIRKLPRDHILSSKDDCVGPVASTASDTR